MHQVVMELGVVSEYDPVYRTPCFSDASPMHLQSSSAYSDTLCIGLHMLHNSAPPPASTPPHVPPLLVCLFVYLCHWCMCCLFCLFVCLFPLPDWFHQLMGSGPVLSPTAPVV